MPMVGNDSGDEESLWLLELIEYNRQASCLQTGQIDVSSSTFCLGQCILSHNPCLILAPATHSGNADSSQDLKPAGLGHCCGEKCSGAHVYTCHFKTRVPWKAFVIPEPWRSQLDDSVLKLKRTAECFHKVSEDPYLDCYLPPKGSSSGKVLLHACRVIDSTLERKGPMVFKVGWTHCPSFRFRNSKYGYCYDRYQKWEQLVVLHTSVEPIGPSYLEAALIEKYRGILDILNSILICFAVLFLGDPAIQTIIHDMFPSNKSPRCTGVE